MKGVKNMKVSAVTSYSYNTKQNIVKHKAQVPNESNNVDQDVAFKGKLWSAFGAAGGAVLTAELLYKKGYITKK
jgi:hypothetical protein